MTLSGGGSVAAATDVAFAAFAFAAVAVATADVSEADRFPLLLTLDGSASALICEPLDLPPDFFWVDALAAEIELVALSLDAGAGNAGEGAKGKPRFFSDILLPRLTQMELDDRLQCQPQIGYSKIIVE